MTLTELMIATILVGIVMAGVVSVDFGIRNMRGSASKMNDAMSNVSVAMLRITQDAQQTTGDRTDVGVSWSTLNQTRAICFRQEATSPTLNDYSDDTWTCYTHQTTSLPPTLYRCANLASAITDCPSDPGADEVILNNMVLDTAPNDSFFTIVNAPDGQINYIHFKFKYRPSTGAAHYINNPEATQESNAYLPKMSR